MIFNTINALFNSAPLIEIIRLYRQRDASSKLTAECVRLNAVRRKFDALFHFQELDTEIDKTNLLCCHFELIKLLAAN